MSRAIVVCWTLIAVLIATGCASPVTMTSTPMPLEIRALECPEIVTLGPTESYGIAFQVLENGQPAKGGIVVNFLVGDADPEVSPREATTDQQGWVVTTVTPVWQDQRKQTIVIGAMILPQRVGASCTTEVRLTP